MNGINPQTGLTDQVFTCDRCDRRTRNVAGWNVTLEGGLPVGYLCPRCQTPEENAEAEVNEATTDYTHRDAEGRLFGRPKGMRP